MVGVGVLIILSIISCAFRGESGTKEILNFRQCRASMIKLESVFVASPSLAFTVLIFEFLSPRFTFSHLLFLV